MLTDLMSFQITAWHGFPPYYITATCLYIASLVSDFVAPALKFVLFYTFQIWHMQQMIMKMQAQLQQFRRSKHNGPVQVGLGNLQRANVPDDWPQKCVHGSRLIICFNNYMFKNVEKIKSFKMSKNFSVFNTNIIHKLYVKYPIFIIKTDILVK